MKLSIQIFTLVLIGSDYGSVLELEYTQQNLNMISITRHINDELGYIKDAEFGEDKTEAFTKKISYHSYTRFNDRYGFDECNWRKFR